jgi:uncharacterized protein DUF2877
MIAVERLARAGLAPVPPPRPARMPAAAEVEGRGRALLAAQGIGEPLELVGALREALPLASGVSALLDAAVIADPSAARDAALLLAGCGPGLTPLGDDLLVGAAVAMRLLGPAAGIPPRIAESWTSEIAAAADGRTAAGSAELIRLAALGYAVPPLHGVLDFSASGELRWRVSLTALERIGATSGRAWALAAAAICALAPRAGKPACTVGMFPMTTGAS